MKKQLLSCLLVLALMCLGACNQNDSYIGGGSQSYIECDLYLDLNGGTSPSYPGVTIGLKTVQVSEITSDLLFYDCLKYGYEFAGWTYNNTLIFDKYGNKVNDCELTTKMTFKAKYSFATKPFLSGDGKSVVYGYYPQTYVKKSSLLSSTLDSISMSLAPNSFGWYLYNDEYYVRATASPKSSDITFNDSRVIVSGELYWFKVEPISWDILQNSNNECYLLSSVLLDAHCYQFYTGNSTIDVDGGTYFINNYEHSEIRRWLNNEFYNMAFFANKSSIKTTCVDNSQETTNGIPNNYSCENTEDKVFLPSYKDYRNTEYGFVSTTSDATSRYCKTTDWARARGAFTRMSSDYKNNGCYWTRSPDWQEFETSSSGNKTRITYVKFVFYNGGLNWNTEWGYPSGNLSVRPAITIKIN